MMNTTAMEVLLLDTTEKEGEDNKLYHYWEQPRAAGDDANEASAAREPASRWSELRGVFAAAMGTMTTLVGEPLATAHFGTRRGAMSDDEESDDESDAQTIVAYVNLHEVLYVLIFVDCTLPTRIVEYYARSSCALVVSLLGYPDERLESWRERLDGGSLSQRLTPIFRGIFNCIRRGECSERDLRWDTHLQFGFDGLVPAVTYPLEMLARLSAFQVIEPHGDIGNVVGYSLFYRRMLVVAKTRADVLKLQAQWLLYDDFEGNGIETEPATGASVETFAWYDAHFALHGGYPDSHTLVRIRLGEVQCIFLIHHQDITAFGSFRTNPLPLLSTEDLEELAHFSDGQLRRHYETSLTLRRRDLVPNKPVWFCVVLDKLRHTILAHNPQELFATSSADLAKRPWIALLELLVKCTSSFQRHLSEPHPDEASQARKPWIPHVKLDVDNRDSLLLRPMRPEDSGADLSADDVQIFPPIAHQIERAEAARVREIHQEAERHCLPDGRFVWVIANYYEAFDLFAVCDVGIPIAMLEQEMDKLLLIA